MLQVFWLGVVAGLLYSALACGAVVMLGWCLGRRGRGEPGA